MNVVDRFNELLSSQPEPRTMAFDTCRVALYDSDVTAAMVGDNILLFDQGDCDVPAELFRSAAKRIAELEDEVTRLREELATHCEVYVEVGP